MNFFFDQSGSKSAQNGLIYHTNMFPEYTELVPSPGEDILLSVFLCPQTYVLKKLDSYYENGSFKDTLMAGGPYTGFRQNRLTRGRYTSSTCFGGIWAHFGAILTKFGRTVNSLTGFRGLK